MILGEAIMSIELSKISDTTVTVTRDDHGWHTVRVVGEIYGLFGEAANAQTAADWWARYLTNGGHSLTDDERRLNRRDTFMGQGITFREYLGGPARTPDLWEVFQGGVRVGRYRTEKGVLSRIERLKSNA